MSDELMQAIDQSFEASGDESAGSEETLENDGEGLEGGEGEVDGEKGGDEGAGDDDADKVEPKPKPKINRAQKRINELTRRYHEAQRRLQELEGSAADEDDGIELPEKPTPPNPRNFSNERDYLNAVRKFDRDVGRYDALVESSKKIDQVKTNSQQRTEQAKVLKKIEAVKDTLVEVDSETGEEFTFDDAAEIIKEIPCSDHHVQVVQNVLGSVDNPAELIFHLGKNVDLTEKLMKLPPARAAAYLYKISVRLEGKKKPAKLVSGAPKPAGKVAGGGGAANPESSMEAYQAHIRKQLKQG